MSNEFKEAVSLGYAPGNDALRLLAKSNSVPAFDEKIDGSLVFVTVGLALPPNSVASVRDS